MLITIENEAKRLGERTDAPIVVTAFSSVKSRSPVMARFSSPHEAFCFVEQLTRRSVIQYVQQKGLKYQVETFTGVHEERFDWSQYQTPRPSIDAILAYPMTKRERRIEELHKLINAELISEANGATPQYVDGAKIEDPVTCGNCGMTWNDALITGRTPAPSARCPYEYIHPEIAELKKLEVGR